MRALSKILIVLLVLAVVAGTVVLVTSMDGGGELTQTGAESSAAGLVVNEFMASNGGVFPDNHGNYSDWIEIYNPTERDISLSGLFLSDSESKPGKYTMPNVTLKAGGYFVVFASGDVSLSDDNNYHAGFKLSTTKLEEVVLSDASGTVIDKMDYAGMTENCSYARKGEEWVETEEVTPGYPNTDEGYDAFLQSRYIADSPLVINEVVTGNNVSYPAPDGNYYDYVEIVNRGTESINIGRLGLSDDWKDPLAFRLPDCELAPGQCVVVFCTGGPQPSGEGIYAAFGLNSYSETVVLTDAVGRFLDNVTVSELAADTCYRRVYANGAPTDQWETTAEVTPGLPNTPEGYAQYLEKHGAAFTSGVIISEAFSANTTLTLDGTTADYIELKNISGAAADISGWALTTNTKNPAAWRFPAGTSIAPGGYLTVLCTDEDTGGSGEYLHANFGLSQEGEIVALFDLNANPMDVLRIPSIPDDITIGKTDAGGIRYFTSATPSADNGAGFAGFTKLPSFSQTPGVYDGTVSVELYAGSGETIHYTTDCTLPTASSPVYSGALSLSENTVIRAISLKEGYITGSSATGTYLFTTDGADHALPVVSLTTEPDSLWDAKTGIYAYGENFDYATTIDDQGLTLMSANWFENGDEWERAASIEVFGEDGVSEFQQNVGISIAGAYGRSRAQKGFNVIARDEYGEDRMKYAFFDNREYTEYKSVVLRAGAQDQNRSKIRDELSTGLLEGSDVNFLYQAYKPCVLYLNGEYWGVYFIKEKRNRFFVAQHEGTENKDDMLIGKASSRSTYGSTEEWASLMEWVSTHDLSVQENYDYICSQVDVTSFRDYMVCELYNGNSDYGNIQYYKLPDGKWKWIYYDFCWGFSNIEHKTVTLRRGDRPAASGLFNALLQNAGWKDDFCRRFAQIMETVFSEEKVLAKIEELYAQVEPEIAREREKFNGETFMGVTQYEECRGSYESFQKNIEYLKRFAAERPAFIKSDLQSALGLSDAYMEEVFG